MSSSPARTPALGDLEIAVLKDIWDSGPSDVKSVHSRVGEARSITSNTVQSTLERLYRKGLLDRSKSGHAYAYTAAVSCGELVHRLVESTVSRVAGSHPEVWLSAFVDLAAKADEVQLDRLEALIAQRRAELDRDPC